MNRISEQQKYDGMYDELPREEAKHFYNHLYRTIRIGKDPHNDCYSFNKIESGGRSFEECIRQYLNYYDGPVRFFVMNDPSYDIEKMHRIRTESKNMNKKLIRLTESDLHRIVKESVNRVLNEIGDTPRGNFALNAVRGRRAAKHYRTNMGANAEAENNKVMGMASDTAWKNYQENPKLGYNNEAGYHYGFDKGVEKYGKV